MNKNLHHCGVEKETPTRPEQDSGYIPYWQGLGSQFAETPHASDVITPEQRDA